MDKVRRPSVAGTFYPRDPIGLRDEINILLSLAQPVPVKGRIFGIIAPHAGYIYSGKTASFGYNLLKDKDIDKVILLSPSHREYFPGISIYKGDGYETPFGIVATDHQLADRLVSNSKIIFRGIEGHKQEHAVEVQLPFLQTVLHNFTIVPVVMGDQRKMFVEELAEKIASSIDDKTVIIASSDLSHYYSRAAASSLDSIVVKRINNFEYENLQKDFDLKNCEACGAGPMLALMKAAQLSNIKNSLVLHHSDSGDTSGDISEVVGYLSAVFYGN